MARNAGLFAFAVLSASVAGACDAPLPEIPGVEAPARADGDSVFAVCNRPAWSPDGNQIAFSYDADDDGLLELHVVGADGGGLTTLARAKPRDADSQIGDWHGPAQAVWSPDGKRIAFNAMTLWPEANPRTVRTTEWQQALYMLDVGTGEVRPLDGEFTPGASPTWSPDGRQIVFSRVMRNVFGEEQADLFEIDLARGEERQLTDDSQQEWEPAFSPDGKRLAYTVSVFGSGHPDYDQDIVLADLQGGAEELLLNTRTEEQSPAWSPDGQALAVVIGRGAQRALAIVPASGGAARPIGGDEPGMQTAAQPAWSPDGSQIVFCAPGSARFGLYSIPVHGAGRRAVIPE